MKQSNWLQILWIFWGFLFTIHIEAQTNASLTHDGIQRTFVYYVPSSWTPTASSPLMLVLHGLTQTGAGVMDITQFNTIAEANHFIVCYPDGINNAWNANMNITVSSADDLGFIEALANHFQTQWHTDPAKQYLVGFSNGGFMSHKLACESSMCFAAIASVSGNMSDTTYNNCNPYFSPSILHIHGTNDLVVPYNGGAQTGVSVDQTMAKWSTFLNCNGSPTQVPMPNTNLTDLSSPTRITYPNCAASLEHIKITGGGHQWPGISTLLGGAGIINMDFFSPQVIWDFLNGKSCPITALQDVDLPKIEVLPNPTNHWLHINGLQPNATYEIFSLLGQQMKLNTLGALIDVSNYPNGFYYIVINQGGQVLMEKWFKEQ